MSRSLAECIAWIVGASVAANGICRAQPEAVSPTAKSPESMTPSPPASPSTAVNPASPPAVAPDSTTSFHEMIAQGIIAASPVLDPADTRTRDRAAEKLAKLAEFIDSCEGVLLWSRFDPSKGYDPASYRGITFEPMAWVKVQLSTYMFTGEHDVRKVGDYTIVRLAARFRGGLDNGDYPFPIWHSQVDWQLHLGTKAIILVYKDEDWLSAMYEAEPSALQVDEKKWDEKWEWIDSRGRSQPRASTFAYVLSVENPDARKLVAAYTPLRAKFQTYNCLSCHSPENPSNAAHLVLLAYPMYALAVRDTLPMLLTERAEKPGDPHADRADGIPDKEARKQLLRLAEAFKEAAANVLAYESARRAAK